MPQIDSELRVRCPVAYVNAKGDLKGKIWNLVFFFYVCVYTDGAQNCMHILRDIIHVLFF